MRLNLLSHHHRRAVPKYSRVSAFWNLSEIKPSGCREWLGSKVDRYGYGRMSRMIDGQVKYWLAHRYAWFLTHGPIPEGLLVCHKCDNPSCVNPDHLFLGTHDDNMADMKAKGRQPKCSLPKGFDHHNCKVTRDMAIYVLMHSSKESQRTMAHKFGVSQKLIWRILHNRVAFVFEKPECVQKVVPHE